MVFPDPRSAEASITPSESTTPPADVWASQEPFRRLIETTQDLVTAVDEQGVLLYVNPSAEHVLGLSPAACIGRSSFDFVHEDDRERTQAAFRRWIVSDPSQPLSFENRQVHVDGSVRDMHWTVTRQTDGNGGPVLVSIARDVSSLRSAERDLTQREIRLRSVIAGMVDAVVTIDAFGIIQFASNSVRAVFGYDAQELVGQSVNVLMPEPHRSGHDAYLARYRETGETWILNAAREFEALRKSGARFWVELTVARIDVPGQEMPMFCGSFRDVTARKHAEAALRESEERFRAIFDQEFQLVGLLGPTGLILEMNQAAMDLVGVHRSEVEGLPFWETKWWSHNPELQARCKEWVRRAGRGEFVREEVEFIVEGRQPRVVDFSLKPILDEEGRVTMILPEGRDVSALKQAQARETQMLKALAAIGESASILAHEIKNPITSINLALRAMATQLGEDDKAVLEELVGRMQKLEGTIRRTLSFAKPLDFTRSPTEVLPLLLGSVDMLRDEAEDMQVDLGLEVAQGCPPILADAGLIEELITNLVCNALDAVERGGRVKVTARRFDSKQVELAVEDDGPGVSKAVAESLFRPFTTTKAKGTGLGLALAKKIVEEHGGTIDLGSGELGGARFFMLLPIAGT